LYTLAKSLSLIANWWGILILNIATCID
jgi:hypothetical protein